MVSRTLFLVGLLAFSISIKADGGKSVISNNVADIVQQIANINELMDHAVGYSAKRPKQWDNFVALRNTATTNEFVAITDHSNSVVRCYAFWALQKTQDFDLYPILLKHIDDSEPVKELFGDQGGIRPVSDVYISFAWPELTESQQQKIYSRLLDTEHHSFYRNEAIEKSEINEKNYPRIRDLALNDAGQALIQLAKYNKEQDIDLILNYTNQSKHKYPIDTVFIAIDQFHHPRFLPFLIKKAAEALEDDYYGNTWVYMYSAIAKFKSEQSVENLRRPFTEVKHELIRVYHLNFLFDALAKNYDELFDELLWQLWEKENRVDSQVLKKLFEKNPDRAYAKIKHYLTNPGAIQWEYQSEALFSTMFELAYDVDPEYIKAVLDKQLAKVPDSIFPSYARIAGIIQDPAYVEVLFKRIRYWPVGLRDEAKEALRNYSDPEVKQRLLDIEEKE